MESQLPSNVMSLTHSHTHYVSSLCAEGKKQHLAFYLPLRISETTTTTINTIKNNNKKHSGTNQRRIDYYSIKSFKLSICSECKATLALHYSNVFLLKIKKKPAKPSWRYLRNERWLMAQRVRFLLPIPP